MKKIYITSVFLLVALLVHAQEPGFWAQTSKAAQGRSSTKQALASEYKLYTLNVEGLQRALAKAPSREQGMSSVVVDFPTPEGTTQRFRIVEASVMHRELAAKYPGIHSYAGQGIDDPTATIRISISQQQGFHGTVMSGNRSPYFIDPYTTDLGTYQVYGQENMLGDSKFFECLTSADAPGAGKSERRSSARTSDKKLRKYRLALSCTGEVGLMFGGAKESILARMNFFITRVNSVFERDLSITLELVRDNDRIIFNNKDTDPWNGEWNKKTQQTIDQLIGDANYDIGHNLNIESGGNAGCIGCVGVTGRKGSGYTGMMPPPSFFESNLNGGDAAPVLTVILMHELGHQFGAWHIQSTSQCRSGSGFSEVEPGSGSTIMGYAGTGCGPEIQSMGDSYFGYVSIRDISANVQYGLSSKCGQVVTLANNPPTANAGQDYVIPKSTAFVLRGQGSDPDGDALTYCWEQNDPENPESAFVPAADRALGPLFRSRAGTASPDRYMPAVDDVINNNLTPKWEVIPSIARALNFSLTVRDNRAGGGQTADDLMRVNVDGASGPFVVKAPNTAVTWYTQSEQTVEWDVANTHKLPVNCLAVNILLSTDGGYTYPYTLAAKTANDGSETITVPGVSGRFCRIKVEAADNIFYDISNTDFTIQSSGNCTARYPTNVLVAELVGDRATFLWDAVHSSTYEVQYKASTSPSWITIATNTNRTSVSGLTLGTRYDMKVRSKCSNGMISEWSPPVSFVPKNYCQPSVTKNEKTADIKKIQLGSIKDEVSGQSGYFFSPQSTSLHRGVTYTFSFSATLKPSTSFFDVPMPVYRVWIDFNGDGDFDDANESICAGVAGNDATSCTFTVPSGATIPAVTRMRVSMLMSSGGFGGVPNFPTPCGQISSGEVRDYTVNILAGSPQPAPPVDTQAPTAPGDLKMKFITNILGDLSWNASTDNVGVVGYDVLVNGKLVVTTQSTTYRVAGLAPETEYAITVKAKDESGNSSASILNITTAENSYCSTHGQGEAFITQVQLGMINHSSGQEGRGSFKDVSTNLVHGASYTLTVASHNPQGASMGYAAWIDFNRDGKFTDYERVLSQQPAQTNVASTTVQIPVTFAGGKTRLRVSAKVGGVPTACGEPGGFAGELEDYTVIMLPDAEAPSAPANLTAVMSTPASATISWLPSADNVGVANYVVRLNGVIVHYSQNTSYELTQLPAGTANIVSVIAIDGQGNTSPAATTNIATNYCQSRSTSQAGAYISYVKVGSIDNTSTASAYSDFTSMQTTMLKGTSTEIMIRSGNTSVTQKTGYAVWIDFNRDGNFEDTGERVVSELTTYVGTLRTMAIPPTSVLGSLRMRVAVKTGSLPTSCEVFGEGEVEDYTIMVAQDTEAPTMPKLSYAGSLVSQITWQPSSDNVGVTHYEVYIDGTLRDKTTATSYLTYLDILGFHTASVIAKDAAGNASPAGTMTFERKHCTSYGQNSADFHIKRVRIRDRNQPGVFVPLADQLSGDDEGFADNTAASINMAQNGTYDMLIERGGTATDPTGYALWMDFNRDGDFADANETVYSQLVTSASTYQFIQLPTGIVPGPTVMRVSVKKGAIPGSCEVIESGEVEDYTVNILPQTSASAPSLTISNIEATTASLSWIPTADASGYVVSLNGSVVANTSSASYTLRNLKPFTIYDVSVRAKTTAGDTYESSAYFTTAKDTEAPSAVSVSFNPGLTSLDLSWSKATDNVGVAGYEVSFNGKRIDVGTSRSYKLTGGAANTNYYVVVIARDAAGNQSTSTAVVQTYCRPSGNSVNDFIQFVQVGSIYNFSEAGAGDGSGYTDFTSMATAVEAGKTYNVSIASSYKIAVADFPYNPMYRGFSVFVDYNHDGDFTDAGELVGSRSKPAYETSAQFSFTIPVSAKPGPTRMRVRMQSLGHGVVPTSCGGGSGEAEDYILNIQAAQSSTTARTSENSLAFINSDADAASHVYPNPVKDRLYIQVPQGVDVRRATVIASTGVVLRDTDSISDGIDVSDFGQGVYLLQVQTNQGLIRKKFMKQ